MDAAIPKPRFTDKQGQYLAFIPRLRLIFGRPPAEADMQRHFRVTPPPVHQMVVTLESRGLIRRRPGVARSIELLVSPDTLLALQRQPVKSSVLRSYVSARPDSLDGRWCSPTSHRHPGCLCGAERTHSIKASVSNGLLR
jgi:hypothetical protein